MGTNNDNIVAIDNLLQSIPKEKLEEAIIKNAATNRVINDPLPGPMIDAIVDQELTVTTSKGNVTFRPVVIYDFTIFKKINSPHYRTMLEAGADKKELESLKIEDEEMYEMIFQFTHSCKEIRSLLKKGRDAFREAAIEDIADKYSMSDLNILLNGVAKQIQKGFVTMVEHDVVENKDVDTDVEKKT